jgi:hypothetical protein
MVRSESTSPCKRGLEENFCHLCSLKKGKNSRITEKIQSPHIANDTLLGNWFNFGLFHKNCSFITYVALNLAHYINYFPEIREVNSLPGALKTYSITFFLQRTNLSADRKHWYRKQIEFTK